MSEPAPLPYTSTAYARWTGLFRFSLIQSLEVGSARLSCPQRSLSFLAKLVGVFNRVGDELNVVHSSAIRMRSLWAQNRSLVCPICSGLGEYLPKPHCRRSSPAPDVHRISHRFSRGQASGPIAWRGSRHSLSQSRTQDIRRLARQSVIFAAACGCGRLDNLSRNGRGIVE